MRSIVAYAVLAVVRDQPDTRGAIASRFQARYGELFGSRPPHVYRALRQLREAGLVKQFDTLRGSTRQPWVRFEATAAGLAELTAWLRSPLIATPLEQEVAVRLLSVRTDDEQTIRGLLDAYESATLAQVQRQELETGDDPEEALFRELERVEHAAALDWVEWARRQLGEAAA
jgi:DNA-binding PadR family transcriptional regulator